MGSASSLTRPREKQGGKMRRGERERERDRGFLRFLRLVREHRPATRTEYVRGNL